MRENSKRKYNRKSNVKMEREFSWRNVKRENSERQWGAKVKENIIRK